MLSRGHAETLLLCLHSDEDDSSSLSNGARPTARIAMSSSIDQHHAGGGTAHRVGMLRDRMQAPQTQTRRPTSSQGRVVQGGGHSNRGKGRHVDIRSSDGAAAGHRSHGPSAEHGGHGHHQHHSYASPGATGRLSRLKITAYEDVSADFPMLQKFFHDFLTCAQHYDLHRYARSLDYCMLWYRCAMMR